MQQAVRFLGFRGLFFLSIGILTVVAVIRRRWRKASANEEEVLRLLSMASEETAMAELEANSAYGFVKKEERPLLQCAVCFCPTTRRCSQCKSIRYCSGKCQIAHWRQGHKDECNYMRMKYAKRSDLQWELDSSNDEEKMHADSGDANMSKDILGSDTLDRSETFVSDDISSTMESNYVDEKAKSSLPFNKAKIANSKETPLEETLSKAMAKAKLASLNKSEDGPRELKSKEVHTSCTIASDDHRLPSIGEHLVSGSKSAKADDFHSLPAKTCSVLASPEMSRSGIKTSVRKVVQQFRASKLSKCDTPSTGNEIAGKQKLVFPYELFVNLYTDDMMVLVPFGLTNCGNSCYANAVLQCLAFTRPLTSYFLYKLHSKSCRNKSWCFVCEFEYLIHKAREGASPVSPIRILSKLHKMGSHLGHGKEEDAHEFLRYAVETMQSVFLNNAGALGTSAEESTLAGMTFGGHLLSKIKCMKCLRKSEHRERMMDLTVEIDGEIGSLEEALTQFTATETLDRDNKYHCIRCKSYERARKKLTLLEAPNILTIVLKRFKSGNFEKLSKSIRFPEVLDIAPYMSSRTSGRPPLYDLYAVVVHLDIMNSAFSGHYVCYVKSIHGKWFKIDDTSVQPVKIERVLSEGAYMLLYARQSPRPPSMITESQSGVKFKKRSSEAVGKLKSKLNDTPEVPGLDPYEWARSRSRGSDSLSESSSIFSSSDASSSSTVSTSTEDFTDYIFGDRPNSLLSPFDLEREEDKPAISSRHRKISTSDFESDFRENPFDVRTGLSSRRSSAQTIL